MNLGTLLLRKDKKAFNVNFIYLIIVFYALFAFKRVKYLGSIPIDGHSTTNLIFILSIIWVAIFFKLKDEMEWDYRQIISFLLLTIICIVGFLFTENKDQSVYAIIVTLLPLLFLIFVRRQSKVDLISMIKIFVIISMLYCAITIFSSLHQT